jgi:tetratricopeptide (TPR) repeat protein
MRAALDQSWRQLTGEERAVFARLSVFRGGFTREAAEQVAGAQLPQLATLADKSLLHHAGGGRYQLHELLRQYAAEQLAADPGAAASARRAHSDYFVALLRAQFDAITGPKQLQALAEIAAEIDNIRFAWQRIVGAGQDPVDLAAIDAAYDVLGMYYELRCLNSEGLETLEGAVRAVRKSSTSQASVTTLAGLLVEQVEFLLRLGEISRAKTALEESAALYDTFNLPLPPGHATDPYYWLGIVAHIEGDFATTARLGEQVRRRAEATGHKGNLGPSYYLSSIAAHTQGQYRAARYYAERAYAADRATGNRWALGHCHHHLASAAEELGAFEEAKAHYQAAYSICAEFGNRESMALALSRQGRVAILQGDYAEARALYSRSLPIFRDLANRGYIAEAWHGLGRVALGLRDWTEARRCLNQALDPAMEIGWALLILRICVTIATLLIETGQAELGVAASIVVLRHPATARAVGDRAQRLLLQAESTLAPDVFAAGMQLGQAAEFDIIVTRLRAALAFEPTAS